ncbi:MAG: RNA 3'-terminal phosphate cyclase [Armatimonadota bacterium]|nr:RNA 3'-terminal phosphate cyclase [Armatimonadota bacterium]
MKTTVHIDGSQGEGGGQILRTSLSLSVLTGRPVEFTHIRAGRSRPGLQPQHLAAVRAAAALCAASLEGDAVGSTRLLFAPQTAAVPGEYHFDIGTAGATTLVVQTVLLPLTFAGAEARVTVRGGTHVPHAPTAEYLSHVYAATLGFLGLTVDISSLRAGFFPKGGGVVEAELASAAFLHPVDLTERGELRSLTAHIVTANLPPSVAERGAATVRQSLAGWGDALRIEARDAPSLGPGASVVLVAECANAIAGFSAIGERGKPMERVADEACDEFQSWWASGAACDEHGADQWALPAALSSETSRWTTCRVTEHLRTVLGVIQQFLPVEVNLEERPNGSGQVMLRGVSLQ